jgi:chitin disaccharide deacetylase
VPPGPRLLIITADDFGLTDGVNEGIQRAHSAGGLTATTVLVNGLAAEGAEALPSRWPDLDVGIHVNLTLGRPVSDPARISSLVGAGGEFLPARDLMTRALGGRIRGAEVRREVEAQISRLRALGVEPTHWDAHQQAAFWPGLVGPAAAAAWGAGLRRARTPRVQALEAGRSPGASRWRWRVARPVRFVSDVHRMAAAMRLGRRFALPARQLAPHLVGGDTDAAERWRCLLALVPPGISEAVSHPAVIDEDVLRLVPRSAGGRAADLAALSDPALTARLRAQGVRMIGFRNLPPKS